MGTVKSFGVLVVYIFATYGGYVTCVGRVKYNFFHIRCGTLIDHNNACFSGDDCSVKCEVAF